MTPHSALARRLALLSALVVAAACSSDKKKDAPAPAGTADEDAAQAPAPPECRNPKPVLGFDGQDTGYVLCEGGATHRPAVHACPTRLPRTQTCGFAPVDGGPMLGSCSADSECTTKPNGFCTVSPRSAFCFCDYGCTQDADCGAGNVCVCGEPMGRCVAATCTSDADCGGLLCLSSNNTSCGKTFSCQKPTDPCTVNTDCTPPLSACTVENGSRACKDPGICP